MSDDLASNTWLKALDVLPRGMKQIAYSAYEHRLVQDLRDASLPGHVAVLADGNRRWARHNAPGEELSVGYQAGASRLKQFVHWCDDVQIGIVTLWVLSTDNLQRSKNEELLPLLDVICGLVEELASDPSNFRIMIVGDLDLLPATSATRLRRACEITSSHTGMHINVAVSYGGRHELRDAFRSLLADEAKKGTTIEELAETLEIEQISEHLYTKGQPDPDLIIRTSGEQRLSGFLMWQSAHSEFYFCEALWPDFRRIDFYRALRSYAQRERRYGV